MVLLCTMIISKKFHKKFPKLLSLLLVCGFILSCKSLPQNTPTTTKRYAVGQGGGFTGAYVEYSFSDDGKVYKRDFKYDRDLFIKQLSDADLHYFLNKVEELGLATFEINAPGNMSTYFEIRDGETSINKIIWGATNYYPPNNLVDFHQELFKKLSALE